MTLQIYIEFHLSKLRYQRTMEAQQKRRKPPPVPRFQETEPLAQNNKKSQLESKLNDFLSSISQGKKDSDKNLNKQQEKQKAIPVNQIKNVQKASLASLNSKLNSMLSSKKLSLNNVEIATSAQTKTKSIDNSQPRRKQLDIEYDIYNPNTYETAKDNYLRLFQFLAEQQTRQINLNDKYKEQKIQIEEVMQQQQPPEDLQERQKIALRMMQKFGYKVGDGLGKKSQGIKTPLTVKKMTDSSCIIEPSNIPLQQMIRPQTSARNVLEAFNIQPSPVIVLNGIVKIHQLTEETQREIRQECENYGKIEKWMLYAPASNRQLRIFVKYSKIEQAFQAFFKMNNLYFNETLVSVRFYSERKFDKIQLDDSLHQHLIF